MLDMALVDFLVFIESLHVLGVTRLLRILIVR